MWTSHQDSERELLLYKYDTENVQSERGASSSFIMDNSTIIEGPLVSVSSHDKAPGKVESPPWWKLGGEDYSYVSIDGDKPIATGVQSASDESLDERVVRKSNSVFQSPEALEIYKPDESYEGFHRFDPSCVWTKEEEKALVKRVRSGQDLIHRR